MKIHGLSFDIDGCLFNDTFDETKDIIKSNSALFTEIKAAIHPDSKTVVFLGSARQDFGTDSINALKNTSCFPEILKVAQHLEASFDPLLMADVYSGVEPGTAFREALSKGVDYNHKTWDADETKVSIHYAQMQKLVIDNPEGEGFFDVYDDKPSILRGIYTFFENNTDLIPNNLTLRAYHYKGGQAVLKRAVVGTGSVDLNYAQTVKDMASIARKNQTRPRAPLRVADYLNSELLKNMRKPVSQTSKEPEESEVFRLRQLLESMDLSLDSELLADAAQASSSDDTLSEDVSSEEEEGLDVILPTVEETATAIEGTAPVVEEMAPVVEEMAPVVEEMAPVVEEPAPAVEEPAPVVEEPAPAVEEPAPVVEETTPVVEETTPVVEEPAPVVEETTPVVEETTPVVEETAPVVEETTPVVEETAPNNAVRQEAIAPIAHSISAASADDYSLEDEEGSEKEHQTATCLASSITRAKTPNNLLHSDNTNSKLNPPAIRPKIRFFDMPKPEETKFPASYKHLWAMPKADSDIVKAKVLLRDYTKQDSIFGSLLGRIFTGHWNRHHVFAVEQIEKRNHDTIEELLADLKRLNPRKDGSLDRRIRFIESQVQIQPTASTLEY